MIKLQEFIEFIFEGGNIKGPHGEVADPISTKNRSEVKNSLMHSLSELHKSFGKETGKHLFGVGQKALKTGSAFSGSTHHLVDPKITDSQLHIHKPTMGDIDTQVPKEHLADLSKHLHPGKTFGDYTVVGMKKHGVETSVLAKHKNGQHHQIDFEGVKYENDEPTEGEQFAHSSSWSDTKNKIKGSQHKKLLHAAGLDRFKYSTHGLKDKTAPASEQGEHRPEHIAKSLFGKHAGPINSFDEVAHNIKQHMSPAEHQKIINKFSEKGMGDTHAIEHLKKILHRD